MLLEDIGRMVYHSPLMNKEELEEIGRYGFRMPAEWSKHSGTLMVWPHNRETWPGKHLEKVEAVYRELIRTLLSYEPVVLLAATEQIRQHAVKVIGDRSALNHKLHTFAVPVNDVWVRDSGPIAVHDKNGEIHLTNWEFNSWGEKYSPWSDDNQIPARIAEQYKLRSHSVGKILEGGSIDTNGEGVFLTTESVLLNPNRNPELSRADIEAYLETYLGAKKVIWLKNGLKGDDTDGHIDDLARFVNHNTIVTTLTEDRANPNYDILYENLDILMGSSDLSDRAFNIITLPLPETAVAESTVDGSDHVPSSYANFYIANGAVLVPLYDSRTDQQAIDIFKMLFPNRKIEGIQCGDLVWGQGSIHCITQQLYGIDL